MACCGDSTWNPYLAWSSIVLGVLAIFAASLSLDAEDQIKGDEKVDEGLWKVVQAALILLLVIGTVEVVLGIILLIKNKREKLGLLWTSLIITGVCAALSLISGIVSVIAGDVGCIMLGLGSAVYSVTMISHVHRRIQNIKIVSGGSPCGA